MAIPPDRLRSRGTLVPRDPFSMFRERLNQLFDEFPGGLGRGLFALEPFGTASAQWVTATPNADIYETATTFEITVELPGLDVGDVEIEIAEGVLTIKGEKREENVDEGRNFHLVERCYGSFRRAFAIPDNVDENAISAEFAKGILTITLPKHEPTKSRPRHRKIDIESR